MPNLSPGFANFDEPVSLTDSPRRVLRNKSVEHICMDRALPCGIASPLYYTKTSSAGMFPRGPAVFYVRIYECHRRPLHQDRSRIGLVLKIAFNS